jgi:hypothetical protein
MLPIVDRSGVLGDPKAGASPLPADRITGDPVVTLRASDPIRIPSVVNPLSPQNTRPPGAFEPTYSGVEPDVMGSEQNRQEARLRSITAAQRLRLASSPTGVLDTSKPTGWDWIAGGRRVVPNIPGGVRGLTAVTRQGAARGVAYDQTRVPILVAGGLDKRGRVALGRAIPIAMPKADSLTPAREPGAAGGAPPMLAIVAAVIVVFLIVRG